MRLARLGQRLQPGSALRGAEQCDRTVQAIVELPGPAAQKTRPGAAAEREALLAETRLADATQRGGFQRVQATLEIALLAGIELAQHQLDIAQRARADRCDPKQLQRRLERGTGAAERA